MKKEVSILKLVDVVGGANVVHILSSANAGDSQQLVGIVCQLLYEAGYPMPERLGFWVKPICVCLNTANTNPSQPESWILEGPADRWESYSGVVEVDFQSGVIRDWELGGLETPLGEWLAKYPNWSGKFEVLKKHLEIL